MLFAPVTSSWLDHTSSPCLLLGKTNFLWRRYKSQSCHLFIFASCLFFSTITLKECTVVVFLYSTFHMWLVFSMLCVWCQQAAHLDCSHVCVQVLKRLTVTLSGTVCSACALIHLPCYVSFRSIMKESYSVACFIPRLLPVPLYVSCVLFCVGRRVYTL